VPLTGVGLGVVLQFEMGSDEVETVVPWRGTSGEMRISPSAALARGQAQGETEFGTTTERGLGRIVAHPFLSSGNVSYDIFWIVRC
jgi:hypothetical protein